MSAREIPSLGSVSMIPPLAPLRGRPRAKIWARAMIGRCRRMGKAGQGGEFPPPRAGAPLIRGGLSTKARRLGVYDTILTSGERLGIAGAHAQKSGVFPPRPPA